MSWWLKARLAHSVLPGGLAGFALLSLLLQDRATLFPALVSSGTTQIKVMAFVPAVVVAVLLRSLESSVAAPEASGTRPVVAMDACLIAAVMGLTMVISAVIAAVTNSAAVEISGRNVLFLTALALTLRPLIRRGAVLVPVAWVFFAGMTGFRLPNDPYPWAITFEPLYAPHALLGTILMFLLGLFIYVRNSRTAL